jgi:hypothetical protein
MPRSSRPLMSNDIFLPGQGWCSTFVPRRKRLHVPVSRSRFAPRPQQPADGRARRSTGEFKREQMIVDCLNRGVSIGVVDRPSRHASPDLVTSLSKDASAGSDVTALWSILRHPQDEDLRVAATVPDVGSRPENLPQHFEKMESAPGTATRAEHSSGGDPTRERSRASASPEPEDGVFVPDEPPSGRPENRPQRVGNVESALGKARPPGRGVRARSGARR